MWLGDEIRGNGEKCPLGVIAKAYAEQLVDRNAQQKGEQRYRHGEGKSEQRRNFPVSILCHGVANKRNQHAKAQKNADILFGKNEQSTESRKSRSQSESPPFVRFAVEIDDVNGNADEEKGALKYMIVVRQEDR